MNDVAQTDLRLDRALPTGKALKRDLLNREPFAAQVVDALRSVSPQAGLVVSVEGGWGSGKTSVLRMVEELLMSQPPASRPVVVHFNPWVIGERDALLRQFFAAIAKEVKLADHAKEGRRVAKELKTYSKVFDVLKFIPGAEPWASMVKSVMDAVGDATTAVFDYKTPDIEAQKHTLERALAKFPRRIIVLIDDLDRLFATEAFEMVRIVKAVGDLPNIGYVLAWDEKYVSTALDKLNVPLAAAYLDKIVQVRLRVPPMSFPQRLAMMNRGLERLPAEAHAAYFEGCEQRHAELFHSGLSEVMEHPRDIVRLFDTVASIEPGLRGEIQFSDIIGLASLLTKAPRVYDLLHRLPQAFVGRRPGARPLLKEAKEIIALHAAERDEAIELSSSPPAVRDLVHWLFPSVATHDKAFTFGRVVFAEGHLAHPDRLLVALQMSARPHDVSLARARDFIQRAELRERIAGTLDKQMCVEFVTTVGNLAESLPAVQGDELAALVTFIARLADRPVFVERERESRDVWGMSARRAALQAIGKVVREPSPQVAQGLAELLILDPGSVSVATSFAVLSFNDEDADFKLKSVEARKPHLLQGWADNFLSAIQQGRFFNTSDAGWTLWMASQLTPERCAEFFSAFSEHEPSLDQFGEHILRASFDSTKGQSYGVVDADRINCFVPLEGLKAHAVERLKDDDLKYPTRAAWRSLVEGLKIYGVDGSPYRR